MHDLNNISLLFHHMEWADAKVWQSVFLISVGGQLQRN